MGALIADKQARVDSTHTSSTKTISSVCSTLLILRQTINSTIPTVSNCKLNIVTKHGFIRTLLSMQGVQMFMCTTSHHVGASCILFCGTSLSGHHRNQQKDANVSSCHGFSKNLIMIVYLCGICRGTLLLL